MSLKLNSAVFGLALGFIGATAFAAAPTASTTQTTTRQAQDSANGSMTNTDLTGNVDQDTSALQKDTTSGTTSGAIIDRTSKKKTKKMKSKPAKPDTESTTSGTSTTYGTDAVDEVMTTEGVTPNDKVLSGEADRTGSSSSTSGSGGGL